MPEWRECFAHFIFIVWLWEHLRDSENWRLLGIWADATSTDKNPKPADLDCIHILDASNKWKRGTKGSQTHLWPPMWAKTHSNSHPPPITTLELKNIRKTNRSLILDFGGLWFQLSYLTHTSIQLYKRSIWENSVHGVPSTKRGFRIGIAFEFEAYVLTFITLDFLIQPVWALSFEKLPPSPPDVCTEWVLFLQGVADWIRSQMNRARTRLASEAIRDAGTIWSGIGVYTTSELFFDSGLSPFLTEAEVFDCPSRTARFCAAFYSFAKRSVNDLWGLLSPCIHPKALVLAPTVKQRLTYADWLHVYGKSRSRLPHRMGKLLDNYKDTLHQLEQSGSDWYRDSEHLYDVFDPEFIRLALDEPLATETPTIGSLIFGSNIWSGFGYICSGSILDPLTVLFTERGLLDKNTYLCPDHYTTLFAEDKKFWSNRETLTYRAIKQIWTVVPSFPRNSYSTLHAKLSKKDITLIEGQAREDMLFRHMVEHSNRVAIGPLEYCGNGTIILGPGGKEYLYITQNDPAVPTNIALRAALKSNRKTIKTSGRSKDRMTNVERTKVRKIKDAICNSSRSSSPNSSSTHSTISSNLGFGDLGFSSDGAGDADAPIPLPLLSQPLKKRRISFDRWLASQEEDIENDEDVDIGIGSSTRSTRFRSYSRN